MALKACLPAIKAEWLWKWQEKGTLEVAPIDTGSGALIVTRTCRPQVTFHVLGKGQVKKITVRYYLATGTPLIPRWDPWEEHCDPVADEGAQTAGINGLKRRGMFRWQNREEVFVLIYQHLKDICAAERQQVHIQDAYSPELGEIEAALAEIEAAALEHISYGPGADVFQHLVQRKKSIYAILPHLTQREAAVKVLRNTILTELKMIEKSLRAVLISKPFEDLLGKAADGLPKDFTQELLAEIQAPLEGLKARLVNLYFGLHRIRVRPIVRPLRLAQNCLRMALGALEVVDVTVFERQVTRAANRIAQAQKALEEAPQ